MEQNHHKRVYINPNFKRIENEPWPSKPIRTTHFNRHYLEEMPNRQTDLSLPNSRKIYVNPYFINGNNNTQIKPTNVGHIKINENVSFNNAPNREIVHKSKYSLVQNFQRNVINKPPALMETNNKNNVQPILSESHQHVKKSLQEVPLAKSKYFIIRKKKRLSVNSEYKSVNNMSTLTKLSLPINSSNQLTCTNLPMVQNSLKNKLTHSTPENIAKIKVTKYKTVPVSYLKNNSAGINKNKYVASPIKSYLKNTTKLIICNKNRYKFTKPNTPIKFSTPVSATKTVSRIIQNKERSLKCIGSKAKLVKGAASSKFNLNNIPCRLFTKYGKCLRQDRGNCKYLHDKKHVSLCVKFLKGICHEKYCNLSHELSDKKMPTCYFYLKGMCTKESCPYLHVKLSEKTKICQEFTKGYCESGDKCLFRHVKNEKIKKIRKQLAQNCTQRKTQNKVTELNEPKSEKNKMEHCDIRMKNSEETEKCYEDCRYYKESLDSDARYENIKPSRCKLGTLPSFIQL